MTLMLEQFVPHIGAAFAIAGEATDLPTLTLEVAQPLTRHAGDAPRAPFWLLFSGSADARLPQTTVPLVHPQLGVIELFLVPTAPPAGRGDEAFYGATFN